MEEYKHFRWTSMPSSRKADYYLAYCDDSVFIDFDDYNSDQIVIIRISFDGYGCCNIPSDKVLPVSKEHSLLFKMMFNSEEIDQDKLKQIITCTLKMNIELIWEDALNKYELI